MSSEEMIGRSTREEKEEKTTNKSTLMQESEHVINGLDGSKENCDNSNTCSNELIDENESNKGLCLNLQHSEKEISTIASVDVESEIVVDNAFKELEERHNLEENKGTQKENEYISNNSYEEEYQEHDANDISIDVHTQKAEIDPQQNTTNEFEQKTFSSIVNRESSNDDDMEKLVCGKDMLSNDTDSMKIDITEINKNSNENILYQNGENETTMNIIRQNESKTDDTVWGKKVHFLNEKSKVALNNQPQVNKEADVQSNINKKISFKPPPPPLSTLAIPATLPTLTITNTHSQNKQIKNVTCNDNTKSLAGISFPKSSFKCEARVCNNNTNSKDENSCNRKTLSTAELATIKKDKKGKDSNEGDNGDSVAYHNDNEWLQAFSTEELENVDDSTYFSNCQYGNWLEERRKAYLTLNQQMSSKERKYSDLCNSECINKYINFADGLIANVENTTAATTRSMQAGSSINGNQEENSISGTQTERKISFCKVELPANAEEQKSLILDDSVSSCKLMSDTENANDLGCTKVSYENCDAIKLISEDRKHCMQSRSNANFEDWAASGAPLLSERNALKSLRALLFNENIETCSELGADASVITENVQLQQDQEENMCESNTLESLSSSTITSYMLDLHSIWQLQLKSNKNSHQNGHETLEDVLKKSVITSN